MGAVGTGLWRLRGISVAETLGELRSIVGIQLLADDRRVLAFVFIGQRDPEFVADCLPLVDQYMISSYDLSSLAWFYVGAGEFRNPGPGNARFLPR